VSDAEIRDALQKSKISWKFRYWVESEPQRADKIADAMQEHGFAQVMQSLLESQPEVRLSPADFVSPYVTWMETPSELLAAIQDLPVGKVSRPIPFNDHYYIIQIMDIRREGLFEHEFEKKREQIEQVLFYRKVAEQAPQFVDGYMTPKQVTTRGAAFRRLADALAFWKKHEPNSGFSEAVQRANPEQGPLFDLQSHLHDPLVVHQSGQWSISEFLPFLNMANIQAHPDDRRAFRGQLNLQMAIAIRNRFFIADAEKMGLAEKPSLRSQLEDWQDKWVYEACKSIFCRSITLSEAEAAAYFTNHKSRYRFGNPDSIQYDRVRTLVSKDALAAKCRLALESKIDSLRQHYPVLVNTAILDTIQTVESSKSRWFSLAVFKSGSRRPVAPTVDPFWQKSY
jgi:hypothetical protein